MKKNVSHDDVTVTNITQNPNLFLKISNLLHRAQRQSIITTL